MRFADIPVRVSRGLSTCLDCTPRVVHPLHLEILVVAVAVVVVAAAAAAAAVAEVVAAAAAVVADVAHLERNQNFRLVLA